jgi:hypothetical protein
VVERLKLAIADRRRKPRARERPPPAPRTTRPACKDLTAGKTPRRNSTASSNACSKGHWSSREPPKRDRERQPCTMERPQASQPPRYNDLRLGGARAEAAFRTELNYSQNVSPAPGSRQPQQRSKTACEASKPAREDPAATDKLTNADSRSRCQPTRPPKPNASGCDLGPPRRRASRSRRPFALSSRSAQRSRLQLRSRAKRGFVSCKPLLAGAARRRSLPDRDAGRFRSTAHQGARDLAAIEIAA